MANVWYELSLAKIGNNTLDLGALTDPRIIMIEDGEYTLNQTHEFLDDVPVAARMQTASLSNFTFGVSGTSWIDADDPTFLTPTVATCKALIVYDHKATEATSELLCYIDSGVGLPLVTESSRDVELTFNANGIAKL